tara:strand:- start:365 stop:808 length:444 start_codon:yes stop_codon:yes gene_type:complete
MTTKTYYKITFPDNTCYIGTTKIHPYERWGKHLTDARLSYHKNKHVQVVYNKYGYDEWVFEVLFVETGDKKHHSIRELTLIKETSNTLNIDDGRYALSSKRDYYNKPNTYKEYYINNKAKKKAYNDKQSIARRLEKNNKEINNKVID